MDHLFWFNSFKKNSEFKIKRRKIKIFVFFYKRHNYKLLKKHYYVKIKKNIKTSRNN